MLAEFKTAQGKKLSQKELLYEIRNFILEDEKFDYRILIGTDSEYLDHHIDFVSVIVVHRIGNGARYFWRREVHHQKFGLQERLWKEALISLNVGQELLKHLFDKSLNFSLELHLDLGYNGKSSKALKEIINLVRSYGFNVKIKPESYAASKIADRLI